MILNRCLLNIHAMQDFCFSLTELEFFFPPHFSPNLDLFEALFSFTNSTSLVNYRLFLLVRNYYFLRKFSIFKLLYFSCVLSLDISCVFSAALLQRGSATVDIKLMKVRGEYLFYGQSAIDFSTDLEFYDTPFKMCLQMEHPDILLR